MAVPPELEALALKGVRSCPERALRIEREDAAEIPPPSAT